MFKEEITMNQADYNELVFLEKCREELRKAGYYKTRPLNQDELPRAQPCHGFMPTHRLEFDPATKEYTPVPIIPQHERGA